MPKATNENHSQQEQEKSMVPTERETRIDCPWPSNKLLSVLYALAIGISSTINWYLAKPTIRELLGPEQNSENEGAILITLMIIGFFSATLPAYYFQASFLEEEEENQTLSIQNEDKKEKNKSLIPAIIFISGVTINKVAANVAAAGQIKKALMHGNTIKDAAEPLNKAELFLALLFSLPSIFLTTFTGGAEIFKKIDDLRTKIKQLQCVRKSYYALAFSLTFSHIMFDHYTALIPQTFGLIIPGGVVENPRIWASALSSTLLFYFFILGPPTFFFEAKEAIQGEEAAQPKINECLKKIIINVTFISSLLQGIEASSPLIQLILSSNSSQLLLLPTAFLALFVSYVTQKTEGKECIANVTTIESKEENTEERERLIRETQAPASASA